MAAKNVTVDALYHVMQSVENKLGGGEGVEGVYGSITQTGMQKVINCLVNNCKLGSRSVLVDIGAGLGRPLLHALLDPGVADVFGVEMDSVKVQKAVAFGPQVLRQMDQRGILPQGHHLQPPEIRCASVEQVSSLEPATHAYSFWEGVPIGGKEAFGKLFAKSKTLKAVAVVQRAIRKEDPSTYMYDLGFGPLLLLRSFPVKMSGSGRSFQAYIFSKLAPDSTDFTRKAPAMSTPCAEPIPQSHPTASPAQHIPHSAASAPHIHTLDHTDSMDSTQSGFMVGESALRQDPVAGSQPAGLPSRRARTSRGEAAAPPPSNTSAPAHPTASLEDEEPHTATITATAAATSQSPASKAFVQKTITSFTKSSKTAAAKAGMGKDGLLKPKVVGLGVQASIGKTAVQAELKRQIAAAAVMGLEEAGSVVSVRQAQASSRELRRHNRAVNVGC